jgi:hypothetical protein
MEGPGCVKMMLPPQYGHGSREMVLALRPGHDFERSPHGFCHDDAFGAFVRWFLFPFRFFTLSSFSLSFFLSLSLSFSLYRSSRPRSSEKS